MIVIALEVFVSLMLVAAAIVLFVWTVRSHTLEHSDRMALAPLEADDWRRDPSTPLDDDERSAEAPHPESKPPFTAVEEKR